MPRHHSAQPDPDQGWPSCDDEQPGVSIRPLSHADLAALLAHLDHHQHDTARARPPRPVVAVRVRATVGRPGASAQAIYRRRRAAERAAGLGWLLRFRPNADSSAWRRGAAGERRTARLLAPLERHGWAVLHDLAVPGSAANIDHLVIGAGGVVVIDSKQYRGRLELDRDGLLWHGRHLLISRLRRVRWEADQADEVLGIAEIQVGAIVAVHGARIPWGHLEVDGVSVAAARWGP